MKWYGHVLRRDDDNGLSGALDLEVHNNKKPGQPKKTWKKQVKTSQRRLFYRRMPRIKQGRKVECEG